MQEHNPEQISLHPLTESIKNGVVNPADMLRIKGFLSAT